MTDTGTRTAPSAPALPPAPPGARAWATLALGCLLAVVPNIDLTALNLAIPQLGRDLHPTSAQIVWMSDTYGFALSALLITMGWLGDRFGRKRLLLAGTAVFAVASALTAYAGSAGLLITARAVLGVAGASLMPSALGLIRTAFPDPRRRTFAVGLFGGMGAAGVGLGPLIGGLMLDHFWWGSVFLINVPIMAAVLAAGTFVLPADRARRAVARLDLISVPLSAAGVLGLAYGITTGARSGFGGASVLAALAAGAVCLVLFLRRQPRVTEPLVDLRLFRNRAFSGAVGANLVGMFALTAQSLLFSLYFQQVLGWSPLTAGVAGLPGTVAAMSGSALAAPVIGRLGRAGTVAAGMTIAAAGFALYGLCGVHSGYPVLLAGMLPGALGVGLTFAVTMDTVLAAIPRERASVASAISETGNELGAALGVATLGTVLSTVYRDRLRVDPAVPHAAASAARDSLGAALSTAARLPERLAAPLTAAAKSAFVDGMHAALLVSTGLALLVAVAALFALRDVPTVVPESSPEPQPSPSPSPAAPDPSAPERRFT